MTPLKPLAFNNGRIWSRQQQYSSSFNNFCDMHVKLFDLHPLLTILSNSLLPTQVDTII